MTTYNLNILSKILQEPIFLRFLSNHYEGQYYKNDEIPSYEEVYTPPIEEGINQQDSAFDSYLTKICNIY